MKRIFIFFITTFIFNISFANPLDDEKDQQHWEEQYYNSFEDERSKKIYNDRKKQAERGAARLKQHRWQTGYIMPQHYRGNGYKVDYRVYNLPKPHYNEQWYKINNDYILVNLKDNYIVRIINF